MRLGADFEVLAPWAKGQGLDAGDVEALLQQPQVRALFEAEVEEVNRRLAKYEQIRSWTLLTQEFTLETGELTPTQKVKRRVIRDKYAAQIEALYSGTREPELAEVAG